MLDERTGKKRNEERWGGRESRSKKCPNEARIEDAKEETKKRRKVKGERRKDQKGREMKKESAGRGENREN